VDEGAGGAILVNHLEGIPERARTGLIRLLLIRKGEMQESDNSFREENGGITHILITPGRNAA